MKIPFAHFWFAVSLLLTLICCMNGIDSQSGVLLWLSFLIYPIAAAFLLFEALRSLNIGVPRACIIIILIYVPICFCLLTAEIGLMVFEHISPDTKISMPPAWERRAAPVNGAPESFYWQGAFHLKDQNGFRHTGPWPRRRPETAVRILVIGDSLTYGLGVAEDKTYPAVLETMLPPVYEVINLGIVGLNSTQILEVLKEKAIELKPDLIIYGVCLNDFLPITVTQEKGIEDYSPPIPYWIRDPLITRTRLGKALNTGYGKLLLSLHLRETFIDEIFDHSEYRHRFAADVAEMSKFVRDLNLPPIIGMVLDQYPAVGSPSEQLAEIAEQLMFDADFNVVYSRNYYQANNGKHFFVSPWEGHPSEEGHHKFAAILAKWING